MNFWQKIATHLARKETLVLLYILESSGSSPGRQGFKMAVTNKGELFGSIGGGIMEHKLVELAQTLLKKGAFEPFFKKQIHRAAAKNDRSGMICSGEQTVAFYYLDEQATPIIQALASGKAAQLILDQKGLKLVSEVDALAEFTFTQATTTWRFTENLLFQKTIYIIGGGHVGLAVSELMNRLDFKVILLDDRPSLNTFEQNTFAHKKHLIDYQNIDQFIPEGQNIFVVLMSFGYRSDKAIIKTLFDKKFRYFGVMGSKEKMKQLWEELITEGFDKKKLQQIHTPIGLPIHSKTPMEIAVSIAAEIIALKNKN